MAKLFVVATPIGNLKDITLRALDILKEVDFVLAEDTRVAKKLLEHFGIKKEVISYHQHSGPDKMDYILGLFREGKNLALVSDSGTPGISDPGARLVAESLKNDIEVIPVPGPSAVIAAASIAGFPMDKFIFMGFPPAKNKRNKFFERLKRSDYPVIIYESPHRVLKTLQELSGVKSEIVVCREITKKFETICRGTAEDIVGKLKEYPIKGEFVIIINNEKD